MKKLSKKVLIERRLRAGATPQEIVDALSGVKKQYVYTVKSNMKRNADADKIDLDKLIKEIKNKDDRPLFSHYPHGDTMEVDGKVFKYGDEGWEKVDDVLTGTDVPDFLKPDMVNHPPHYKRNGIEVVDVIEAFDLNYRLGNVVKYVLRHIGKNGLEDLKKAQWYLDREIEKYEGLGAQDE